MDLSEYQEIQKVNRLLEESLDNERKLQEEVIALKQEKIDILKDAEKTVTIVERIDRVDSIKILRSEEEVVRNILNIVKRHDYGNRDTYSIKTYDNTTGRPMINTLADAFFETVTNELYSQEKSVTRKGFDEVRQEAKEEFKKDIQEDFEMREASMEGELKDLRRTNKELEALSEINSSLHETNSTLIKELENKDKRVEQYGATLDYILGLSKRVTFFNRRTFVREVKTVLKNLKNN